MQLYYNLQVKFVDEEGIDEGGPKREFWQLLAMDIQAGVCVGSGYRLTLEHDILGLQVSYNNYACCYNLH